MNLESLTKIIDKRQVISDPAELIPYEIDATNDRGTPDAVVFPRSREEVSRLVQWAAREGVPLVARGAGTGLSGGSIAEHGGLVVEFSRLNRVLDFDAPGRTAIVEPGLVNLALDTLAKSQGLYFPPDPASGRSSTIGGNIAENAGGPHCFKYGVTTNYVTGLEVALADGRLVQFGGRARDYPEYDLVGLLNGSEGTLGIITQAYVRLLRNPPGVKTMICAFDTVEGAGEAVSAVIASGLVPATMELMDRNIMRIVEDYVQVGLPVHRGALLLVEVDGYPTSLDSQVEEIVEIFKTHGAQELRVAQTAEERDRLWYGRKSAAGAMARLAPAFFLVDCTVPRSQLAEMLGAINQICKRLDLTVGYVFHAGDGNLHPNIPYFPSDKAQVERGWQACQEILQEVVKRDGSITGEHGVGIEKREAMLLMYDGAELAAMRDVKEVFDPRGIMNPAKVLPAHLPTVNRVAPADPIPGSPFSPATATAAAAGLAALSEVKSRAVINRTLSGAVTISTRALGGIKKYAPDDLYISVGAGTPLVEVQDFLAKAGRQVPLATPWPEMTVGGIVATNLNSPQRMRYGSVRDLMLCCTVALADGRVIRAGRPLVKNVAGYDLPKAFVGSYGTLGLITEVTFKLLPQPRAQRTLLIPVDDLEQGLAWGSQLLRSALVASAILLLKGAPVPVIAAPYVLAYTAEGLPQDVESELAQVETGLRLAGSPEPVAVDSPTGMQLWAAILNKPAAVQARGGVPPKDISHFVRDVRQALEEGPHIIDFASGLVYAANARQEAPVARTWLESLHRGAEARGGYAIATYLLPALEGTVERWGYKSEALDLMLKLKARWDPVGIFDLEILS